MKKVTILTALLLFTCFFSPVSHAQSHTVTGGVSDTMSEKKLYLPKLNSKKNIYDFKKHSYKYYGISVDVPKDYVIKKWSKPTKKMRDERYYSGNISLIYGAKNNVTINYEPSSKKVMSIDIIDKSMKYEFSKLLPLYKKDFIVTNRNGKKFISNDCTIITFEKSKGHFYATEFKYLSYHSFLE